MKLKSALVLALLVAAPGTVLAEQVRLRTGDFLQGEIIDEQSNEEGITFRLYRTGGVFRIRWDQIIEEDEKRLRDALGLNPWEESEVPLIEGHQIILLTGSVEVGVAENPDDRGAPLRLRTATGVREYPRDAIARDGIRRAMVEATAVYTPAELAAMYEEEIGPQLPGDYVELARRCIQVEAYAEARGHLETALADPEFSASEQAQSVQNLLARVDVFLKAEDALQRVRDIKRFNFQKKYDQALEEIAAVRTRYEDDEGIIKLLELDRIERQVATNRRNHFQGEVRRRFFKVLDALVSKKVRERDPDDRSKALGLKAIIQWVANARGLTQEIFLAISDQTGLADQEAREFWENRPRGQARRYSYGGGTFLHPEVAGRVARAMRGGQSNRSTPGSSRGGSIRNRNPQGRQQQVKLKTGDDWWAAASAKEQRNFLKAYYAEFGGGTLQVLRVEQEPCRNCGGKGILISQNAATGEEIRLPCDVCALAGHSRIVICR